MEKELVYQYDGSFEGLLTCIYEAFYRRDNPKNIISHDDMEFSLVTEYFIVQTDMEKFKKVYNSIEEKISKDFLRSVFSIYLSEEKFKGIIILNYIRTGFKYGKNVQKYQANTYVRDASKLEWKVKVEKHRYLGLIRFKMLQQGILYATIEPDHNIISLLGAHFSSRIANEYWMIHDIKRGLAVFYDKEQWIIRSFENNGILSFQENEESYQNLWKTYYKHISIDDRKNLRQKKGYMPTRYWKHLVEEGG